MATKKVTITMTPEEQKKGMEDSKELYGETNLSGYISYLIRKGLNKQS